MATVKFFGWARDLAGTSETTIDVPDGADSATAWELLIARYAALAPHRKSFMLAVNRQYAAGTTPVNNADEIAVIPPVSGG